MKRSCLVLSAVLVVLGVSVVPGSVAYGQGCTASRGCPTIPPSMPSARSSSASAFNFNQSQGGNQFNGQSMAVSTQRPAANGSINGTARKTAAALIRVTVPQADAKVTFQGAATEQKGTTRLFASPAITEGSTYRYLVRCSWREGDRDMVREQHVLVRAGQESRLDFSQSVSTAAR